MLFCISRDVQASIKQQQEEEETSNADVGSPTTVEPNTATGIKGSVDDSPVTPSPSKISQDNRAKIEAHIAKLQS